jgi:hypothetical protein
MKNEDIPMNHPPNPTYIPGVAETAAGDKIGLGVVRNQGEKDEISTEASGEKLLEPVLFGLADRTYFRRIVPGAKVTADPAAPYGQRKRFRDNRGGLCRGGFSLFGGRPPLGNRCQFPFSFEDLLRNVKGAIAGVIFAQVGIPIIARADNIQILLSFPRSQATRAGPVSIPAFIDQQPLNQILGERNIRVQVIPPRLGFPAQTFIERIDFFRRGEQILFHSCKASRTLSS